MVLFLLAVLVTSIVWVVLALIDRRRISDEGNLFDTSDTEWDVISHCSLVE